MRRFFTAVRLMAGTVKRLRFYGGVTLACALYFGVFAFLVTHRHPLAESKPLGLLWLGSLFLGPTTGIMWFVIFLSYLSLCRSARKK